MERFIPYEKLSKKEQRKQNRARRGGWGAMNPVTRRSENPKAYRRNKARSWKKDAGSGLLLCRDLILCKSIYVNNIMSFRRTKPREDAPEVCTFYLSR